MNPEATDVQKNIAGENNRGLSGTGESVNLKVLVGTLSKHIPATFRELGLLHGYL